MIICNDCHCLIVIAKGIISKHVTIKIADGQQFCKCYDGCSHAIRQRGDINRQKFRCRHTTQCLCRDWNSAFPDFFITLTVLGSQYDLPPASARCIFLIIQWNPFVIIIPIIYCCRSIIKNYSKIHLNIPILSIIQVHICKAIAAGFIICQFIRKGL